MSEMLIKGGKVIDPSANLETEKDILIENGLIKDVQKSIPAAKGMEVIDASGKLVLPGLVDLHVHFREPGREDKETIETGSRAAVKGGFVCVCPMPNTQPATDHGSAVEWIRHEAKRVGLVEALPVGAVTIGQAGEQLTDFGELFEAGCIGLSDDGNPVSNSLLMRRALEYAKCFNRPIIQHAEDSVLNAGGVMHEGVVSMALGLRGIPSESESIIIARDIALAELTGGWVHFAHLSSAKSVDLIRGAKKNGTKVTCEVTPHHIALTEEAVAGFNADAKVNPPLRSEADRLALIEGLRDGTIDCIASDHAPHTEWEKDAEFDAAPFGISGLETALGVCAMALVEKKVLSWLELAEKMSIGPAGIAGIKGVGITKGNAANLAIIDTKAKWTVDPLQFVSKGKHTPFAGQHLTVKVLFTIRDGKIVFTQEKGADK